jgi:hypothetical protein
MFFIYILNITSNSSEAKLTFISVSNKVSNNMGGSNLENGNNMLGVGSGIHIYQHKALV